MATHNISFTYRPKIPKVKAGEITQTIRQERARTVRPGDFLNLFAWSGKPYYSKWAWKMKVECCAVQEIIIGPAGITYIHNDPPQNYPFYAWRLLDDLARKDGIAPPTGKELGRVLLSKNNIPNTGVKGIIITWKPKN